MKAKEVVNFITQIAPHEAGVPNDGQSGWRFGEQEQEVTGVTVCWSPTLKVIQKTAAVGANMIVCHEPLFFHSVNGPWYTEEVPEKKIINLKRRELLEKYQICVYGSHSNWDVKEEMGTVDTLGKILGFEKEIGRGFCTRVYEIEPTSVKKMAKKVKKTLNARALRVAGDLKRQVTKVGTALGGLGQTFNVPEELYKLGAEVVIFGEMLDYTIRHAIELDLAVIEAGHIATENPGIKNLAKVLQDKFSSLKVTFIDAEIPWVYV